MTRDITHDHALIIRNKKSGRTVSLEFSTLPTGWRSILLEQLGILLDTVEKPQKDEAALAAIDTQIASLMEQKRIITGASKKGDCGCGCGGC